MNPTTVHYSTGTAGGIMLCREFRGLYIYRMKLFADLVQSLRSRFRGNSFDVLERQRELVHLGVETTAEVMDIFVYNDKVGGMRAIRLWIRIRKADGSFFFTYTHSLAPDNKLPVKGQMLVIRYFPDNLASVAILGSR